MVPNSAIHGLILLCRQHCRLHLTVGRIGQNLKTLSPPQRNKKLKSLQQQLLVPASVYDRVVSTACLLPQNSITHLPNPLPATIMAADTAVGLAPDLLYANEHLAPAKTRSINSPPPSPIRQVLRNYMQCLQQVASKCSNAGETANLQ